VSEGGVTSNCPSVGHAAPGWLCLYGQVGDSEASVGGAYTSPETDLGSPDPGVILYYGTTGAAPYVGGSWTVTEP
jgi:hypothetical protein